MQGCLPNYQILNSNSLSDERRIRPPSGNLKPWAKGRKRGAESPLGFHPLVEEATSLSLADLKRQFGRKALLAAVRDACPVRCQVAGIWQLIYLIYEPHRLPGRRTKWSDPEAGNVRLWLVCPLCRGRARILYYHPYSTLSDSNSLGCRRCLGLRYLSQNSWNRVWFREIVMPLKRLMRSRQRLLQRMQTRRTMEMLGEIEELISIYRKRAETRVCRRHAKTMNYPRTKRQYRNLDLSLI